MPTATQDQIREREAQYLAACSYLTLTPDATPAQLAQFLNCPAQLANRYLRRYHEQAGEGGNVPALSPSPAGASGTQSQQSHEAMLEGALTDSLQALQEAARSVLSRARAAQTAKDLPALSQLVIFAGTIFDKLKQLRAAEARGKVWVDIVEAESPAVLDAMIEDQARLIGHLRKRCVPID